MPRLACLTQHHPVGLAYIAHECLACVAWLAAAATATASAAAVASAASVCLACAATAAAAAVACLARATAATLLLPPHCPQANASTLQDYRRLVVEADRLRAAALARRTPAMAQFQALEATVADMQRRASIREEQLRRAAGELEASHGLEMQVRACARACVCVCVRVRVCV